MVQLEGPTQMAAEMEQAAQSLMNNSVPEIRLAQETLMQAILQLPAYLDQLHREQGDSEKNYLPMVNNLRVSRGEARIQGSVTELEEGDGPDLGPLTKAASDEIVKAYFQGGGEGNLPRIRTRYQQCLGAILKKTKVRENLMTIGKLFSMLVRLCGDSPTGNLAELGLGVVEGVAKGGIKLDNQTATRLKQIDNHLKPLAKAGQHGLLMPVDEELAIGLIKLINESNKETKRISALRQRYASEAPKPEEFAIGLDDETMSAVASILIEELNSVTDKLDLFVRAKNRNTVELAGLVPTLERVSSTMVILGDVEQQVAVSSQISIIKDLPTSGGPSEGVLLNIAKALLEIGAGLGQLVVNSEEASERDSFANLDEAQAAVIRGTRIGLAAGKGSVIGFISSKFDHAKIEGLPQSLNALGGGLMVVNQPQAGDVLEAAANYVANALLSGNQIPELERMDDLADAITSVDYYLERLLENASDPYLQMLEVAETAVEKLGYAVGMEAPAAAVMEEAAAVMEEEAAVMEEAAPILEDEASIAADLVEEVIEEVPEELVEGSLEGLVEDSLEEPVEVIGSVSEPETKDDLIDDENLEIFVDEAVTAFKEGQQNSFKREELTAIAEALAESGESSAVPTAAAVVLEVLEESDELKEITVIVEEDNPELEKIFTIEAEEKLSVIQVFVTNHGPVNRDLVAAFHTLKGSAAMAEISSISTVAAPLEQLVNEYLVQNKPADQHLVDAVQEVASLIRTVLQDIPGNRDSVPGLDALLGRLAGTAIEVEPKIGFDFREIKLLSEPDIAADGWEDVEALVSELKIAQEQASTLNQPDLSAMITSMCRIYSEAPSEPNEHTLSLMKQAHDHLVLMFDAHASSQPLRPAGSVIAELDAIDLNPVEVEVTPESMMAHEAEDAPAQTAPSEVASQELTELPADDIDDDILPIFLGKTEALLEEIGLSILGWSESGSSGDNLDSMLRQLHTIKGGARTAGAASLGEYAHNFENFLIAIRAKPVDFDEPFFALLSSQQDEITRRVEIYQKLAIGSASLEELESLKTSFSLEAGNGGRRAAFVAPRVPVEQTADETPAGQTQAKEPAPAAIAGGGDAVVELPADEVDEDILPTFLEKSDDLVEELEASIQAWSESPGSMDMLDVLLRNLHTLKGGARLAGLNGLGEYAHNFEAFLIGIQRNPIELDDEFFALLNTRQDEVIRKVEIYKKLSFGPASAEDLASLKSALEPTLETDPVEAHDTAIDDSAPEGPKPSNEGASEEASQGKIAASANQEMVRVSADLLEKLIGLAGESSIMRGRVEQQITDFGKYLQEMEETINRIRGQVKRLEIEAESRETFIRSRHGTDDDSGFDGLEMDRYTMLQAISRALNEGSSDMMDLKDTLGNRTRDAETLLHQQARIGFELQEGLTRTRMVPFSRLIPKLRRIVRQVSGEVAKSVRFDAYNVEGELDRNVLQRIVAPLEHMLRNVVDHGIENKEVRVASGKQEQGRISLRLSREGGYVVLTISDDGCGIDVNAVKDKAIERGLIREGQNVSDHEVMQFIMHPGYSTVQKLTQISGRGVGMDVVVSEIKALGGRIAIDSTLGIGTVFIIRIPFTVSINRALMVVVKEETYAVPLNTIEGIVRVSPYELEAYYQPGAPMFEYAGQSYRLAYIGKMLDKMDDPDLTGQVAPLPVILARSGDHAVALQVDRVIGSREVVVRTLGAQFSDVGGISGATVLVDGSVVIILDCMALVRSYEEGIDLAAAPVVEELVPEPVNKVRTVMIVDDSVTVRKVTSRIMEGHGFEVTTAKDGIDAINQLQDIRPDVVLLDIEMPRMDGFEVLRTVRRDENLKDLPIIMITSRTGEKHKEQAIELGVNQYLGKPFQEANLLATIEEAIEGAKAKPEQD